MVITRDTGAAYPLVGGATGAGVQSVPISGVLTNSETTLIVVRVGIANSVPTNQDPVTVTWNGGPPAGASTFTQRANAAYTGGDKHASVWTATCTQKITVSQTITVAANASSGSACMSVAVDALVGARSDSFPTPVTNTWTSAQAGTVTVNGVTSGSWIFVSTGRESVSALANQTDTTEDDERTDATGPTVVGVGVNLTGTSGNIVVGWTTSSTWGAVAAQEILADPSAGVSDTVTTSDVVSMYGPVAFDPTTAFQANAFQHVGAFQILAGTGAAPGPDWSVTDTVTTSDSAQLARVGAVSATDTVTTSDQVALARQSTATVSDSVTVSDDAQIARRAALSASDTVTTSDDAQITRVGAVTASDTVTTSDQALISRVGGLEVSDTVTTFDDVAIATETGATFATTDTVVTSDAIALARALSLGCSDTVTVTDDVAMQRAAGGQLTVTDVVSVTDAVAIARAAVLQISDTVTVTDSVVASGAPTPPVVATRKTGDWIPWWMRHKSRSLRRWK